MKQRLHANMAPIDVLTRLELEEAMTTQFSQHTRERFRGIDSARIPSITVAGNGGTVNLAAISASDGTAGPEQGDVWVLRRAMVASSNLSTDAARYLLFRGSSPSDANNAYQSRWLLDAQTSSGAFATPVVTPSFPGSASNIPNPYPYPVTVVVTGGTATQTQVNGQIVGPGDGTYIVPAGGAIQVTYSVAPTWTWSASQPFQAGQLVNIAYNASNKAVLLQPGEQIYAQVFGTTAGNTYTLTGEAIRVPAEMKGKLLG